MIYINNIAASTIISMSHHLISNVISNIQKVIVRMCPLQEQYI